MSGGKGWGWGSEATWPRVIASVEPHPQPLPPLILSLSKDGEGSFRFFSSQIGIRRILECSPFRERAVWIGKVFGVNNQSLLDQLAALHIVADIVDAIEREQPAMFEIEHRETARRGIAAQHRLVKASRKADGL